MDRCSTGSGDTYSGQRLGVSIGSTFGLSMTTSGWIHRISSLGLRVDRRTLIPQVRCVGVSDEILRRGL
jgi:hypothetical protein